ncbi:MULTISPECIES: SLC13 family permease [unclassified Pseudonocardia]|uniref:SLC13 family permease n=1 Tax=unclassified Pseudonocardia TaxID=2619320 RepID=UPI00094B2696|nr:MULTISPECIES: SLC13 family permease [unclassified Pseudonocardia]OLL73007.1 Dicarboxylate-carrier protein [Pseudonocardia sp. Ae150A_Ps1]OLL86879.1 Dicarboxylate-carrier protein [Pseudonocardia sp. Ae263_Ps1]OLL93076.1 Dicarboxylate-carrier protein [Pseudonocardia sp. Ae356_Ps1]
MSIQLITVVALALVFLIATVLPVHMGALAFVAAFIVGTAFVGEDTDDIVSGFPGDLFVILVGVTLLFAIAKGNGTVDRLVQLAVRAVGGRIALIPWVMFLVTAVLTAVGAVVPAAVAIIAPIGMGFALRYRINPMMMGLLIINGASAGGFSPMSIFGSIVNGVVDRNALPSSPVLLFVSSFLFNLLLSVVVFFLFGGRELIRRSNAAAATASEDRIALAAEPATSVALGGGGSGTHRHHSTGGSGDAPATGGGDPGDPGDTGGSDGTDGRSGPGGTDGSVGEPDHGPLTRDHIFTIVGLVALAVDALAFGLDVGFTALTVAAVLSLISPSSAKAAVGQVAWPTVLLICGIVTFVSLMEQVGTIDWLGNLVTQIGWPLFAAIIICLIGAIVSAFASTTGILGALIPLAVPFLLAGEVGAVGLIIALAISSSVVDSSPFSTSGALVVANAPGEETDKVFRGLTIWGFSMCAVAPLATWLIFVVPGWG